MLEYHDDTGDDHLVPADTDTPDGSGAGAPTEQQLPPLGDLPAPADAPAELHFPGDAADEATLPADLDPGAPFPDDGDFTEWLAGHEDSATGAPPEPLLTAPEDSDALPSSDALVDWTLRELGDEG